MCTPYTDTHDSRMLNLGYRKCEKCGVFIDPRFITSHEARDCKARHLDYVEDEILNLHHKKLESKSTY